jgi:alpha-ketoglutarate-dependent taurine dioxygenase
VDSALHKVKLPQLAGRTVALDKGGGVFVEPLSPTIGSVIYGVDLAALTPAHVALVGQALLERRVVFFHDQGHLDRAEHRALAQQFGECGLAYGESLTLSEHDTATTGHQTAREDAAVPPELLLLSTDATDAYVPSVSGAFPRFSKRTRRNMSRARTGNG